MSFPSLTHFQALPLNIKATSCASKPIKPFYWQLNKMRFVQTLFFSLSLITLSLANHPREARIFRRDLCTSNGYFDCGISCMPVGATCCDASGSYCRAGTVCDGDGCCPVGRVCTGPGGTSTHDVILTGTGAAPTGGTIATTKAAVTTPNTFTVAPIGTATTARTSVITNTQAANTFQAFSTATSSGTRTTTAGGPSTPITQLSGASGRNGRRSEAFAVAILAAGQFLLM
jgi:hypothetical protein